MIASTFSPADIPEELVKDVLNGWFLLTGNRDGDLPQETAARLAICAGVQLVTPVATITPKVAREVLWAYGHANGVEPSDFRWQMIRLIRKADQGNRQRLALAEPAYVAAVQLMDRSPDGVETLTTIAQAGEGRS